MPSSDEIGWIFLLRFWSGINTFGVGFVLLYFIGRFDSQGLVGLVQVSRCKRICFSRATAVTSLCVSIHWPVCQFFKPSMCFYFSSSRACRVGR